MLTDIIDRDRLKADHMITLPPASVTCPECGTLRGPDEILFIRDLGWCRNCSSTPAIYRKEAMEGRKTIPSPLPFPNVSCSHCGQDFGPGIHGFSTCESHEGRNRVG